MSDLAEEALLSVVRLSENPQDLLVSAVDVDVGHVLVVQGGPNLHAAAGVGRRPKKYHGQAKVYILGRNHYVTLLTFG